MESNKVDMLIMMLSEKVPAESIPMLREKFEALPDEKMALVQCLPLKNPMVAMGLSLIPIITAISGLDRIYIGDVGLGILKLITCGGIGIWSIIDWFLIINRTRQVNLQKILMTI